LVHKNVKSSRDLSKIVKSWFVEKNVKSSREIIEMYDRDDLMDDIKDVSGHI